MNAQQVSAEVIPTLEGGRRISAKDVITANNLSEYRLDSSACAKAEKFFRDAGFAVSPVVGISFSITGSVALFERVFGSELSVEESASVVRSVAAADGGDELSLDRLPTELTTAIQAVTFCPVEFDDEPTSFGF